MHPDPQHPEWLTEIRKDLDYRRLHDLGSASQRRTAETLLDHVDTLTAALEAEQALADDIFMRMLALEMAVALQSGRDYISDEGEALRSRHYAARQPTPDRMTAAGPVQLGETPA